MTESVRLRSATRIKTIHPKPRYCDFECKGRMGVVGL